MEKIGLINKLAQNIDRSWKTHQLVDESQEVKKHNDTLANTLKTLKEIKLAKDIKLALGAEEMLLRQELAVYANSTEQHNSITAAIDQLQAAKKSLNVVNDHDAYKLAAETYSGKRLVAGLPKDSFRDFLDSHVTRFTNHMKAQLSVPEKNVLRQRKENMGMIKEVYMGLQREALGLAQEKSKGRER